VDIIRKKLSDFNDDKVAGNDNLSPRLLKAVADEIVYPVATIFRKSLDSGAVPRDWKTANVTPYLKKEPDIRCVRGIGPRVAASRGFKVMLLAFVVLLSDVKASVISIVTVLGVKLN